LATLRLRQAGSGLCPVFVSQSRASPYSSRAKPGTQPHALLGLVFRFATHQPVSMALGSLFWSLHEN